MQLSSLGSGGTLKGLLYKVLVAAALVAAVAVPAASAKAKPKPKVRPVKLSVVPLQKAQLGSAATSFSIAQDSGTVSNVAAASETTDGTAKQLAKLGRVSGYQLLYGEPLSGGGGVTGVSTSIEQYKSPAGATRGLSFWKVEDSENGSLNQGGLAVTNSPITVPAVGTKRYAFLTGYSAANIAPLAEVDERFTDGKYVLDVSVSAGTAGAAKSLAPKLAKALDKRLRSAEAGKLRAKPAKLPAKPEAGPPAGGPDLAPLALKTSDLTGTATIANQGYAVDASALSDYSVFLLPAGQFGVLDQEIEWFPTANEAGFFADVTTALALANQGTQVDMSGIGDGAQGVIANGSSGGIAQVAFSSGQLAEFVLVASQGAVQTSDVQSIAGKAAGYINAAGLGS
jgi:hypothetical protein